MYELHSARVMASIRPTPESHYLVTGEDGVVLEQNGRILLQSIEDDSLIYVDLTEEIKQNFNLNVEQVGMSSDSNKLTPSTSADFGKKLWTSRNTFELIKLVEKYDSDFQTSVKKFVWQKISREMLKTTGVEYTHVQLDTKWKGLQKTYKDILANNSTSGKSRKDWDFYDAMHHFLFKKPEINPVATCSSSSGLAVRTVIKGNENKEAESNKKDQQKRPGQFESNLKCKRLMKGSDAIERRHKEKMERLDKYLETFGRLVAVLETKPEDSKCATGKDILGGE